MGNRCITNGNIEITSGWLHFLIWSGVSIALWSVKKSINCFCFEITFGWFILPKWARCQPCSLDCKKVNKSLWKLPSGCLHFLSGQGVSLALWVVKESIIAFGNGQVGKSVNTPKLKIFVVVICDLELIHLLWLSFFS